MKTIALLTGRGNNTLQDKNILDVLGHGLAHRRKLWRSAQTSIEC